MRAAALGLGLAVALGLASCSTPSDTADTADPASTTTAAPRASIDLQPVIQPGLPCAEPPPGVDPSSFLPHEEDETVCAEVGPAERIDLARAEVVEGGATGTEWVIEVEVADADQPAANEQFNACASASTGCPTGQLAIVVDGVVISAPTVQQPNLADQPFVISGGGSDGFTRAEADDLLDQISG